MRVLKFKRHCTIVQSRKKKTKAPEMLVQKKDHLTVRYFSNYRYTLMRQRI